MANTKSTKAAVLEDDVETAEVELTTKQVVNDGITRAVEALGVDGQKARYKVMRAIAFEAFAQAVEAGTFDDLVDEAIANADSLPTGWELERTPAEDAPKPAAKKATAKPAAKSAPAKKAAAKPATTGRARPKR